MSTRESSWWTPLATGRSPRDPETGAPIVAEDDPFGLRLRPGAHHYRTFVGPASEYDLLTGVQFSLLFCAGMREHHFVLDVGCGSLKAGRLLIPFLRPGHYCAVEPNKWLVEEGLRRETGMDLVTVKRPRFAFVDDFSAESFGVEFDWIMAHSIFSHTYADMAATGFRHIHDCLAPTGIFFATYMSGSPMSGSGWLAPGCVTFEWGQIAELLDDAKLVAEQLDWPHPRQVWFVAGRPEAHELVEHLACRLTGIPLGGIDPAPESSPRSMWR